MLPLVTVYSLVAATCLFTIFYVQSVQPAKLEGKIGEISYRRCTTYRVIASVLEVVIFVAYIVFYFIPSPILSELPWPRSISTAIALIAGIPAALIMFRGIKDSGKEGMSPNKEHRMFEGIYTKVRHPQTSGGVLLWFAIAIGSQSMFLVLFSFVWIPIYLSACFLEEADLVRRFGNDYTEYQKQVGMFFPKLGNENRSA